MQPGPERHVLGVADARNGDLLAGEVCRRGDAGSLAHHERRAAGRDAGDDRDDGVGLQVQRGRRTRADVGRVDRTGADRGARVRSRVEVGHLHVDAGQRLLEHPLLERDVAGSVRQVREDAEPEHVVAALRLPLRARARRTEQRDRRETDHQLPHVDPPQEREKAATRMCRGLQWSGQPNEGQAIGPPRGVSTTRAPTLGEETAQNFAERRTTMSGTQDAWSEVGERFASWGKQVAERYKESSGPARETAKESQRKLEEAAHDITDVLDRAFTALGDTIRDETAKNDLKAAVKALGDAVAVTVSEAGDQVRRRVGDVAGRRPKRRGSPRRERGDGPGASAPGVAPPPPAGITGGGTSRPSRSGRPCRPAPRAGSCRTRSGAGPRRRGIVPRHSGLTFNPRRPRCRYSIRVRV